MFCMSLVLNVSALMTGCICGLMPMSFLELACGVVRDICGGCVVWCLMCVRILKFSSVACLYVFVLGRVFRYGMKHSVEKAMLI